MNLIPDENAMWIARRFGASGERFPQSLPERLTNWADRWRLTLGEPLPPGIGGYLVTARTAEREAAVLKLSPTGGAQDNANELESYALTRSTRSYPRCRTRSP
jgi:hypothetical protein